MKKKRVLVAMSGGVDSSVCAFLLSKEGYEVIGITMKIWPGEEKSEQGLRMRGRHSCYGPEEVEEIEAIAQKLGIPFYVFDLKKEYQAQVIEYFCQEYFSGRTPNPCIICNQKVKFGVLLNKAKTAGLEWDYVATGHYARVEYDERRGRFLLKKGRDTKKDQSYFLFPLSQEQLKHILFPLGCYIKEEVRKLAQSLGLKVYDKPESQDFIADGSYSRLLGGEVKPGPIINIKGEVLGEHKGIEFYTIGQRRGLGIAKSSPLYVIAIDKEKNALIVGEEKELYRDELITRDTNWIAGEEITEPLKARAKIRYHHEEAEAIVYPSPDGKARVKFEKPQKAITPGQAVVFYNEDVVLGGGWID